MNNSIAAIIDGNTIISVGNTWHEAVLAIPRATITVEQESTGSQRLYVQTSVNVRKQLGPRYSPEFTTREVISDLAPAIIEYLGYRRARLEYLL
jgi:hypothetical protein